MQKDAMKNDATKSDATHNEEQFTTLPNLLTLSRIVLVPAVVILLKQREFAYDIAAALVFAAAAITDYFDGHLARSSNQVSTYGKLMDPLADKFLVVCSLICLMELERIDSITVMVLVCRELAITGLRALASAEGVIISASSGGKWKTGFQMTGIPFLMVKPGLFGFPMYEIGKALVYLSLALSLYSAWDYTLGFFKGFKERLHRRKQKRGAWKNRSKTQKPS